jgi:hypothetical protein
MGAILSDEVNITVVKEEGFLIDILQVLGDLKKRKVCIHQCY